MPILQQLQNDFQVYVWKHVQSILVGRMLLREVKTLTALQHQESLPTLSRTLNVYEWPLDERRAVRRSRITQALKRPRQKRGRSHFLYLILDDTVVPKRAGDRGEGGPPGARERTTDGDL
jgi:hypothetical protein